VTTERKRVTWLRVDEVRLLDHWCRNLRQTFPNALGVYLVGSVLERQDYRDVDVRIVMRQECGNFGPHMFGEIALLDLNLLLSLWGQEQTGLPIDCQLQSWDESQKYAERPRHARGIL
jgi:hypothetical protein